jgi:hypothetical protein
MVVDAVEAVQQTQGQSARNVLLTFGWMAKHLGVGNADAGRGVRNNK